MQPMEARPKRGGGRIERNRDSQKFHSNNILDKSRTMIEYTNTRTCTLKNYTKYKIVGSYLATKVFIGNLLGMGRSSVIIK